LFDAEVRMSNRVGTTRANKAGRAERVLIVQLGGAAGLTKALGAAAAIRAKHLGAPITLLTSDASRALAEQCPYFDAVEADGKPADASSIAALIARIRAAKYDIVYDLEGSPRTARYFHMLRPWPPRWSGPAVGARYCSPIEDVDALHAFERYERQLAIAGVPFSAPLHPDLSWVRRVMRDPPRLQPDFFGIRSAFVLLAPRGDDAGWPAQKYAQLGRNLVRQGVTPVIFGGAGARAAGAEAVKTEPLAKNLAARIDVMQSIALAERAAFAVGDDLEVMDIAAAAGARCLVFLPEGADLDRLLPRGSGGAAAFTASSVSALPVEQIERQLRNYGVFQRAATA
jgi:ADP-heptose:LPS heptosyltransferase